MSPLSLLISVSRGAAHRCSRQLNEMWCLFAHCLVFFIFYGGGRVRCRRVEEGTDSIKNKGKKRGNVADIWFQNKLSSLVRGVCYLNTGSEGWRG